MPDNLTMKIIKDHLVSGTLGPGQEIAVRVDQTLLQDATGTMALLQFAELASTASRCRSRYSTSTTT